MTISPYDSLPSGNIDTAPPAPKYVDVEISPKSAPQTPPRETPKPALQTPPKESPKPAQQTPPRKTVPFSPPPKYDAVRLKNFCGIYEYILPFEESLLVPDTMPDMQKVLFADGRVDLAQPLKSDYDANDFLAGDITAYTIYRPVPKTPSPSAGPAGYSDCPVDVVKSIIPFKTDKCWPDIPGGSFKPAASIRSISAEMINERKFIVRGELLIKMTCISDCEMKVFKSADDDALVTLKDKSAATSLNKEFADTTEISQEITVSDDQPSPIKILKTSFDVVENHRQLTSGKLVINSTIRLDALYLGEDDDGEKKLCCLTNKTDFTQFLLMDDNTDIDLISIEFSCNDLKLSIDGKDKFILEGNVTSFIRSYRNTDLDIVRDAYHKKEDLEFDLITKELCCIKSAVSGEISSREVVSLTESDKTPAVLLCGSCIVSDIAGNMDKGRIVIDGTVPVKILALDDEGTPFVIEHTLPIRGSLEAAGPMSQVYVNAAVKEFWFSEINSRQLEINIVLSLTAWVTKDETFCTIDRLRFAEGNGENSRTSMALYVVGSEDTLWDVAKRYKTDIDSLAALNDLDPEKPIPAGAKLFITK